EIDGIVYEVGNFIVTSLKSIEKEFGIILSIIKLFLTTIFMHFSYKKSIKYELSNIQIYLSSLQLSLFNNKIIIM
ncbi:hypothetical protein TSAR_014958, partial [Trichomalopsis sarcophagae]